MTRVSKQEAVKFGVLVICRSKQVPENLTLLQVLVVIKTFDQFCLEEAV